ncbi:hypothetical protein SISNIDRAFT_491045 [Sistotremastrum niveocremeum HHB9708]|uniref:Capsular associated protein n=1 Tax=Sistotremastrum niveocremeum HHB9708 TaxID=1314777 RepID=A0A164N9A9_9AGAM|nr:hypothetical protein SISNIDRAFT_491045 [Sistotremastrum niveocremeum HHB9708]
MAMPPFRSGLAATIILFIALISVLLLFDLYYLPIPERPPFGTLQFGSSESVLAVDADGIKSGPKTAELPESCDFCGPTDTVCKKWGPDNIARSRAYEGPNARLRRIIRKAISGQPIKIGVLGGSVSAGHGVFDPKERWHGIYVQWWRDTFFAEKYSSRGENEGDEEREDGEDSEEDAIEWVQLVDGSIPATQSDYLQSCHMEHIDEDVDLVVVELAINDQRREELAHAYEYLLRSLLILPKNPAIINLQTMGLHGWEISMGGDLEMAIAMYYDTPVINIRNVLLPYLLQHRELDWNITRHYFVHNAERGWVDLRHMNVNGHRAMAEMLISMTQKIYCEELKAMANESEKEWLPTEEHIPGKDSLEYIPRLRMFQAYDNHTEVVPMKPMCMSLTSEKHPLVASQANGWEIWESKQSVSRKLYYRATVPGSTISFNIEVGPLGRARVSYLRSKSFGLGSVWCWVEVEGVPDSEKRFGHKLDGYWDRDKINVGSADAVAQRLPPGSHTLHCRLLGSDESADPGKGTEFRIIAVDSA